MGWKQGKLNRAHVTGNPVIVHSPVARSNEGVPQARSEGLVIEELGDEVLVYDLKADRAHCLGAVAARVWRRCDGKTPMATIAIDLDLELAEVTDAVAELHTCRLLGPTAGISRREFGLRTAKAAAVAGTAPLILSIAAPAAAQVTSANASCLTGRGVPNQVEYPVGFEQQACSTCNQGGTGQTNCCCCRKASGGRDKICSPGLAYCQTNFGGRFCTESGQTQCGPNNPPNQECCPQQLGTNGCCGADGTIACCVPLPNGTGCCKNGVPHDFTGEMQDQRLFEECPLPA